MTGRVGRGTSSGSSCGRRRARRGPGPACGTCCGPLSGPGIRSGRAADSAAGRGDRACAGVGDVMVVGGVPVALRPLGDGVVPGGSASSRRDTATSFPKARALGPESGGVQDGSGVVITPVTARSSHCFGSIRLERDTAAFYPAGRPIRVPAHDLVGDDALVRGSDADSRVRIRSSSGTSVPGRQRRARGPPWHRGSRPPQAQPHSAPQPGRRRARRGGTGQRRGDLRVLRVPGTCRQAAATAVPESRGCPGSHPGATRPGFAGRPSGPVRRRETQPFVPPRDRVECFSQPAGPQYAGFPGPARPARTG